MSSLQSKDAAFNAIVSPRARHKKYESPLPFEDSAPVFCGSPPHGIVHSGKVHVSPFVPPFVPQFIQVFDEAKLGVVHTPAPPLKSALKNPLKSALKPPSGKSLTDYECYKKAEKFYEALRDKQFDVITCDLKTNNKKTGHWIWWVFPTEKEGASQPGEKTVMNARIFRYLVEYFPHAYDIWMALLESIHDMAAEYGKRHPNPLNKVISSGEDLGRIRYFLRNIVGIYNELMKSDMDDEHKFELEKIYVLSLSIVEHM